MKEVIDRVLGILEENEAKVKGLVDVGKFTKISPRPGGKLIFIDGGNHEILSTPSLSLSLIRVCQVEYDGLRKVKSEVYEFFMLAYANEKRIATEYYHRRNTLDIERYAFNADEFDISDIPGIIRRYAELLVLCKSDGEAYAVLDGCFDVAYPHEASFISKIKESTRKFALSKTSKLFIEGSEIPFSAIINLCSFPAWHYNIRRGEVFTWQAKLNRRSLYLFRLDAFSDSEVDDLLGLLANNSQDPVFLGYPHGLVQADKFARVSKEEAEMLVLEFKAKFGKKFAKLVPYLNSLNAHAVLDSIG